MNATLTDADTILARRSKCALLEASLKKADAEVRKSTMDAAKTVFGCVPADVLTNMRIAEETFEWLEEIFIITNQLAEEDEQGNCLRITRFSKLGRHIASDYSDLIGCVRERMAESIKAVDVLAGGAS